MADRSFGILVELKDKFTRPLQGLVAPIEKAKRELKSLDQAGKEITWIERYEKKLQRLAPSMEKARAKLQRLQSDLASTQSTLLNGETSQVYAKLQAKVEKAAAAVAELEANERSYQSAIEQSRDTLRQHGIDTHDLTAARHQLALATDQARGKVLSFNSAVKALDVRDTMQQFSGLATKLLVVKTSMAALSAAAVGLVPVLAKMGATAGMAFGTALSTASVAAMSKELLKFAETTNTSTHALQEWRLAGRFEGIEADFGELGDIGKVFGDLNEQMGKLGTKEGKDFSAALNSIGLTAKEIKALKPEEALLKIGSALDQSKLNDTQKATFLAGISDDAAKLLPLLKKNSASFAEIRTFANQVGAIQTPEQLARMKQTSRELSFWKLGFEGIATQLGQTGGLVVNTLGPNIRQLFVDAQGPLKAWSRSVSDHLAQLKADVDDMGWGVAFQRQFEEAYPTLYGFLAGAAEFGKGYGESFISPMLTSLKAGYRRIADAMGSGDGIEAAGRRLGEMMRPMTVVVDEVSKAIAFLIENFRFMKTAMDFTPLGMFLDMLPMIRTALDWVGNGIKALGQAFGLIDPESKASGFTVLLGALVALSAAAFANKLALGAVGAAFNVFKFALSPLTGILVVLRGGLGLLLSPLLRLVGGAGVLTRAFTAVRVVLSVLFFALRANPIGIAVTAIAMAGGFIIRNWSRIGPWFAGMWSRVKATFSAARAALSGMSWGQIAVKIVTSLATLPARLFQVAVKAVGQMAIGLLSKLGLISGNTARIMTNMVNSFANLPSKLMDIGKNAMAGLADGIVNAGKRALDAAKKIASDIGSAVSGFFDIRSPSRLMRGYGINITEGLAVGITEKQKAAVSSAKQLSSAVAAPLKTGVVVSFAEARKRQLQKMPIKSTMLPPVRKPSASPSALPPRPMLRDVLQDRQQSAANNKQEVGGEIRVRIEAPAGMNTSAKVSKPAGSKVGLTANVGRVSW